MLLDPLCKNIMLFTKWEAHSTSQCRQLRTKPQPRATSSNIWCSLDLWSLRYASRQTDRPLDVLITIPCTPPWRKITNVITGFRLQRQMYNFRKTTWQTARPPSTINFRCHISLVHVCWKQLSSTDILISQLVIFFWEMASLNMPDIGAVLNGVSYVHLCQWWSQNFVLKKGLKETKAVKV